MFVRVDVALCNTMELQYDKTSCFTRMDHVADYLGAANAKKVSKGSNFDKSK